MDGFPQILSKSKKPEKKVNSNKVFDRGVISSQKTQKSKHFRQGFKVEVGTKVSCVIDRNYISLSTEMSDCSRKGD